MKVGILSDTHDQIPRTKFAIERLKSEGADALIHCGDLASPEIVTCCCVLPFYFVFGNHDADSVAHLQATAEERGATCLGWGGEITMAGKRIAVAHGHLGRDLYPLLDQQPDYLLSGHSHFALDVHQGPTRRINPGALHQAEPFTVALLNCVTDELRFLTIKE